VTGQANASVVFLVLARLEFDLRIFKLLRLPAFDSLLIQLPQLSQKGGVHAASIP
jgi:hypothetical protein